MLSFAEMQNKIIVAIDGYSSCGKSTLAKQLAKELQYVYVDSGAMYRAITLYFLQNSVSLNDENQIEEALNNVHLFFSFNTVSGNSDIILNNKNVEVEIREMIVSEKVSEVAELKQVRDFAVIQQRKLEITKGIVMDGRDIGTTVFPNGELKIFMIADIVVRVERRFKELHASNKNITVEEVKANLEMRDHIDSTRAISPLRKADDAFVLDNTNLTMAQQLKIALDWANEKINKD